MVISVISVSSKNQFGRPNDPKKIDKNFDFFENPIPHRGNLRSAPVSMYILVHFLQNIAEICYKKPVF